MQIIGRGLRTAEGKADCLVLDHADNHARLGFVTDIHYDALDDGEGRAAATTRQPPLPKECPQCHFLRAPKVRECQACGFVPAPVCGVQEDDGELVEITPGARSNRSASTPVPTREDKQRWWSGLLAIQHERGYRNGWAAAKYREKFLVCGPAGSSICRRRPGSTSCPGCARGRSPSPSAGPRGLPMPRRDIPAEARGQWRGILLTLGVGAAHLSGKHGPCPACGGSDRFRFDNKEGRGTWFCSHCGAGDGFQLLERLRGWDFKASCLEVASVIGGGAIEAEAARAEPTDDELKAERNALWRASRLIERSDDVGTYLAGRGFEPATYPADLRTNAACPIAGLPGVATMPAMIALVRDVDGKPTTLHRTYVQHGAKAAIVSPRRICRGAFARGSAVPLLPWQPGETLGVAEGVETAFGAAMLFEHPVWSALDAGNMEAFAVPAGCTRLAIYADADATFRGEKAAFVLANRLRQRPDTKHIEVTVNTSVPVGADFADEWLLRLRNRETVDG